MCSKKDSVLTTHYKDWKVQLKEWSGHILEDGCTLSKCRSYKLNPPGVDLPWAACSNPSITQELYYTTWGIERNCLWTANTGFLPEKYLLNQDYEENKESI